MSDNKVGGIHAVDLLIKKSPDQIEKIYLQANRQDSKAQKIVSLAAKNKIPLIRWDKQRMDKLLDENHQGVIAELSNTGSLVQTEHELYAFLEQTEAPVTLLILDGVTDPHNLGACFRSADAAGAAAIVVPKDKSVGLNSTVRKVACGAAETVPFFAVTNLVRCLSSLKAMGLWIVGTAGEAKMGLYDYAFSGSIGLIMGAEGAGMRRLTREHCDELVKIPMAGSVSSLNVSVAAGVCLFEIRRQRLIVE